jgi:hypothetical protein
MRRVVCGHPVAGCGGSGVARRANDLSCPVPVAAGADSGGIRRITLKIAAGHFDLTFMLVTYAAATFQ